MSGKGSETWWRVTHLCPDGPSHTVPQQLYETPCPSPPDLRKTEAGWSRALSCPDQQCEQQNSPPGPPPPKQVTLQWFPAEASPVTLISVVSQGPTVASAKIPPSLLVGHFDATGCRCQGPWGSAPRTVSTQSFQRAVGTPTWWLLLGGPPSFPHGLFLSEIASSRTFPWLCASIPTLGAASLFLFLSGSSGHVLSARWWPLGKASMADGLVDSPVPPARLPKQSARGRQHLWYLSQGPLSTGTCEPAVTDKKRDKGQQFSRDGGTGPALVGPGGHPWFWMCPRIPWVLPWGSSCLSPPPSSQVLGCSVHENIQKLRNVK